MMCGDWKIRQGMGVDFLILSDGCREFFGVDHIFLLTDLCQRVIKCASPEGGVFKKGENFSS